MTRKNPWSRVPAVPQGSHRRRAAPPVRFPRGGTQWSPGEIFSSVMTARTAMIVYGLMFDVRRRRRRCEKCQALGVWPVIRWGNPTIPEVTSRISTVRTSAVALLHLDALTSDTVLESSLPA